MKILFYQQHLTMNFNSHALRSSGSYVCTEFVHKKRLNILTACPEDPYVCNDTKVTLCQLDRMDCTAKGSIEHRDFYFLKLIHIQLQITQTQHKKNMLHKT